MELGRPLSIPRWWELVGHKIHSDGQGRHVHRVPWKELHIVLANISSMAILELVVDDASHYCADDEWDRGCPHSLRRHFPSRLEMDAAVDIVVFGYP